MKINIVCYEDTKSWILGKFALKLEEELIQLPGVECIISDKALPDFDITHHIIYIADFVPTAALNTTMITHVDEILKIRRIKELIEKKVIGICMSESTKRMLISQGCDDRFLDVALPAHDFISKTKKTNLLITSRLYDDGRKNESDLVNIFHDLDPSIFKLTIMGQGWDEVIKQLLSLGIEVEYFPEFDRFIYSGLFSFADFFLYLGHDEGSMGYLDALYAGVTPLVSNQGFHNDLKVKSGFYFDNLAELKEILSRIQSEKMEKILAVNTLNWKTYARKHYELWSQLLKHDPRLLTSHNHFVAISGMSLQLKLNFKRIIRKIKNCI